MLSKNLASCSHVPPVDNFPKQEEGRQGGTNIRKAETLPHSPADSWLLLMGQTCVLWVSLDVREAEVIQRNEQNFDVSQLTADDWIS